MKVIAENPNGYGNVGSLADAAPYLAAARDKIATSEGLFSRILDPVEFETDKRRRLDTSWYYFIFLDGQEVYHFTSHKTFRISEEDIPLTDDELKKIVRYTHQLLQENFENRRSEASFLSPIGDISDESLEVNAKLLRECLELSGFSVSEN